CTATYAPEGGEPQTVVSNEARVRVEPGAPSGLAVGEVGETSAALSWAAGADGTAFTLAYRAAGSQDWTEVTGLTEPSYGLAGLASGTIYEWRVQAVVGEGEDALVTDWVDGPGFKTLAPPEPQEYHVTAGANGTWKPGQAGLVFTVDGDLDKFVSLAVDGVELVRDKDYTAAPGSTVLTLSSDYLATLSTGPHTFVATYIDGAAEAVFTVGAVDPGPGPDDPTPPVLPDGDNTSGTGVSSGGAGGADAKQLAPTGDPLGNVPGSAGVLGAVCAAFAAIATVRLRRLR
ncbi:fibronectin type III domain-containing protein, partial [Gordonibacter urolithinfaciens]|uniref:fibronectin type III domain-containing protein n=1 Tax=Gordonibacter urolithinfaciens TaxID=1335613 RepID=UPI003AB0EB4D